MKKFAIGALSLIILSSHDLYFKTDSYFLAADQNSEVYIFNGTFDRSENTISRDRMISSSIVGPEYEFKAKDSDWYEKGNATHLKFKTGKPGTYLAGVNTKARTFELSAKDFNDYLVHDGILDVLEDRKKNGKLSDKAIESYAKSAKLLLQVGANNTDDYKIVMGYPLEFVPSQNPYTTKVGREMSFQLLRDGKPLANQLVYIGNRAPSAKVDAHGHSHDDASVRTDANGMVTTKIDHKGYWYLRSIHMAESDDPAIDYVSNWATLTFEIK